MQFYVHCMRESVCECECELLSSPFVTRVDVYGLLSAHYGIVLAETPPRRAPVARALSSPKFLERNKKLFERASAFLLYRVAHAPRCATPVLPPITAYRVARVALLQARARGFGAAASTRLIRCKRAMCSAHARVRSSASRWRRIASRCPGSRSNDSTRVGLR